MVNGTRKAYHSTETEHACPVTERNVENRRQSSIPSAAYSVKCRLAGSCSVMIVLSTPPLSEPAVPASTARCPRRRVDRLRRIGENKQHVKHHRGTPRCNAPLRCHHPAYRFHRPASPLFKRVLIWTRGRPHITLAGRSSASRIDQRGPAFSASSMARRWNRKNYQYIFAPLNTCRLASALSIFHPISVIIYWGVLLRS